MTTLRRMTPQQRDVYHALRMLGSLVVTPNDARPLRALKRRGLVRYARIDGVKHAILRLNRAQQRVRRRLARVPDWALPDFWPGWETGRHINEPEKVKT